jgi:adenylate cyclase class 2
MPGRRLQEDCLVDTIDECPRAPVGPSRAGRIWQGLITFKGPVQPAEVKRRDELETVVGDGPLVLTILESLGFQVWFRYQKYREEFAIDDVIVAVDETPVGTFVEIEGGARGITEMAEALGRGPKDYLLDSYRALYSQYCRQRGLPVTDSSSRTIKVEPLSSDDPDRRSRDAVAAAHRRAGQGGHAGAGEPLIRRSVRWLATHGSRTSCSSHHRPETIAATLGDGSDPNASAIHGAAGRPARRQPTPGAINRRRRHVPPDQRRHSPTSTRGAQCRASIDRRAVTLALVPNHQADRRRHAPDASQR